MGFYKEWNNLADRLEGHVRRVLPGPEPAFRDGAFQMMLDASQALRRGAIVIRVLTILVVLLSGAIIWQGIANVPTPANRPSIFGGGGAPG